MATRSESTRGRQNSRKDAHRRQKGITPGEKKRYVPTEREGERERKSAKINGVGMGEERRGEGIRLAVDGHSTFGLHTFHGYLAIHRRPATFVGTGCGR